MKNKTRSERPILMVLDTLLIAFVLYTFGVVLIFATVTISASSSSNTGEVYQYKQ
jgi:hypothetical protein